jgi:hypothetical protein
MKIQEINCFDLGKLQNIYHILDEDCENSIVQFFLQFENLILKITVNEDTDEVILSSLIALSEKVLFDEKKAAFLNLASSLQNMHLQWAWQLINNQGYSDGIQLEFVDRSGQRENICIQLMAMASFLHLSILERVA